MPVEHRPQKSSLKERHYCRVLVEMRTRLLCKILPNICGLNYSGDRLTRQPGVWRWHLHILRLMVQDMNETAILLWSGKELWNSDLAYPVTSHTTIVLPLPRPWNSTSLSAKTFQTVGCQTLFKVFRMWKSISDSLIVKFMALRHYILRELS